MAIANCFPWPSEHCTPLRRGPDHPLGGQVGEAGRYGKVERRPGTSTPGGPTCARFRSLRIRLVRHMARLALIQGDDKIDGGRVLFAVLPRWDSAHTLPALTDVCAGTAADCLPPSLRSRHRGRFTKAQHEGPASRSCSHSIAHSPMAIKAVVIYKPIDEDRILRKWRWVRRFDVGAKPRTDKKFRRCLYAGLKKTGK